MIEPIGRTLNPIHKELGLRPIGDDWILYRNEAGQEDWKIRAAGPVAKVLLKDQSGKIKSEQEIYYSGAEFVDREGHNWEQIVVNYDFTTKQIYVAYIGTNPQIEGKLAKFKITVNGPSTDVNGAIKAVKEVAADWPDGPK
jgi:hypothetical protein